MTGPVPDSSGSVAIAVPMDPRAAEVIAAVVVTMNRPAELGRLLGRLVGQTRPLSAIIVVDNGLLDETRAVLADFPAAVHISSRRNLGGAGGFALGILHALAIGASAVWLMDDDGYPETDDCLARLAATMAEGHYAMVSPLIVDIADPGTLSFYHFAKGRSIRRRDEAVALGSFPQFAHLFNGALVCADTFERHGLPRYELFFRGDETDFLFRLNRGGAKFVTTCEVAFLHPSGGPDTVPIMRGRFHAVIPASPFARYYFHRNRGNLLREFGLAKAALFDLIRYGWAFLITRRGDWAGFANWLATVRLGWKRQFLPFAPRTDKSR
ncbi:glycosyltransferase [Phreatobacter sp. AB_2022a]|uniref:glycosyltransferase n=1 Tax=Phreatobacter sp. AB_2022a TaxID=3003134 RepID=UPI0022875249|nr:glycosyltransferase [Phreatobacter sp. AB_2022a]MCZ0738385.1 glycosyltransferase [Phreatobacter sp. AB_2022a]